MKKGIVFLIMVQVICLVNFSYSEVFVGWRANAGFYFTADPSTGFLAPDASGLQALYQLIYSPDNAASAVDILNAGYVDSSETVLDSFTFTAGSAWGDFAVRTYEGANRTGYVYGRVFQDITPVGGEVYYNSPLIAIDTSLASTNLPPASNAPQDLNLNADVVNGDDLDQTIVAVPEPSTLALCCLGLFMLIGSRRRHIR
jgi:hypothetical protein